MTVKTWLDGVEVSGDEQRKWGASRDPWTRVRAHLVIEEVTRVEALRCPTCAKAARLTDIILTTRAFPKTIYVKAKAGTCCPELADLVEQGAQRTE